MSTPKSRSHRPGAPRPGAFFAYAFGALIAASFTLGMWGLLREKREAVLAVTGAYLIYEVAVSGLLAVAAGIGVARRLRQGGVPAGAAPEGPVPAMSVLIAAYNERLGIEATIESVRSQLGVEIEILVASDGSTDGMNEALVEKYCMRPATAEVGGPVLVSDTDARLKLLALPKVGKGHALNCALAIARFDLVATLDADTRLESGALAALAATFHDASVASVGGFIYIRNAGPGGPWLARYQYWEYIKNFMWRVGLVEMDVCLQVSGAFGAFRTSILRELGGFDGASAVEDYEIIFRLHDRLRVEGRSDRRVEVAPGAVALTDGPETPLAFIAQRTRWFAGFLQTMWDYRSMVGDRRMGALGWLLLPIKCLDALLPIWGVLSLSILVAALASGIAAFQVTAAALFGGKVLIELANAAIVWGCHRAMFGDRHFAVRMWPYILSEGLVFHWFRQVAVLRAYVRAFNRRQRWVQPRWSGEPPPSELPKGTEIPCNLAGSIGYVPPRARRGP